MKLSFTKMADHSTFINREKMSDDMPNMDGKNSQNLSLFEQLLKDEQPNTLRTCGYSTESNMNLQESLYLQTFAPPTYQQVSIQPQNYDNQSFDSYMNFDKESGIDFDSRNIINSPSGFEDQINGTFLTPRKTPESPIINSIDYLQHLETCVSNYQSVGPQVYSQYHRPHLKNTQSFVSHKEHQNFSVTRSTAFNDTGKYITECITSWKSIFKWLHYTTSNGSNGPVYALDCSFCNSYLYSLCQKSEVRQVSRKLREHGESPKHFVTVCGKDPSTLCKLDNIIKCRMPSFKSMEQFAGEVKNLIPFFKTFETNALTSTIELLSNSFEKLFFENIANTPIFAHADMCRKLLLIKYQNKKGFPQETIVHSFMESNLSPFDFLLSRGVQKSNIAHLQVSIYCGLCPNCTNTVERQSLPLRYPMANDLYPLITQLRCFKEYKAFLLALLNMFKKNPQTFSASQLPRELSMILSNSKLFFPFNVRLFDLVCQNILPIMQLLHDMGYNFCFRNPPFLRTLLHFMHTEHNSNTFHDGTYQESKKYSSILDNIDRSFLEKEELEILDVLYDYLQEKTKKIYNVGRSFVDKLDYLFDFNFLINIHQPMIKQAFEEIHYFLQPHIPVSLTDFIKDFYDFSCQMTTEHLSTKFSLQQVLNFFQCNTSMKFNFPIVYSTYSYCCLLPHIRIPNGRNLYVVQIWKTRFMSFFKDSNLTAQFLCIFLSDSTFSLLNLIDEMNKIIK